MAWKTRTLQELLAAEPHPSQGSSREMVVMVNTDEALTLVAAGAKVVGSGSWNLERNTQRYELDRKTFFWLADNSREDFPVSQEGTRLGVILEDARALG